MDEPAESPETMLDALRDRPDWDEATRDRQISRLVERFPVDRLRVAVQARLTRLDGADGEAILRLVEAFATPELLDDLARALLAQPDLPVERAWEALALIEGAGRIEAYPDLAERWDELNEAIDGEDALATLVEQLEEEPDGSWVALGGLKAVEPEVRAEIVAGLADAPTGPGLIAFLRLLTFADDPTLRRSALEALTSHVSPEATTAWATIAHDHPDPEVRALARRGLASEGISPDDAIAASLEHPGRARPEMVGSLVTALDGSGQGSIVLAARDRGRWVVATFLCDVWRGVVAVDGLVGDDSGIASGVFEEFETGEGRDHVEDAPGLALGLLAGSLLLRGPETSPALRYWVERTAGPEFQPRPFAGLFGDEAVATDSLTHLTEPSWLILEACPDWVDRSALTYDLAEEIALRLGSAFPDPKRDSGAYRYLFEHRLLGRLEHYRRLLFWMASFWDASGDLALARSALTLAWQLSDPQHAVPGHPFTIALTTKSLIAAQTDLQAGRDPRPR